ALRDAAGDAAEWVHHGATSQDIIDTALALVSRRAGAVLEAALDSVEDSLAGLAHDHRHTAMAGRTLLRPGAPITFGLKAAGWLVAMVDARQRIVAAIGAVPAQLGGPVGTLAELGDRGIDVVDR